ncbi:UvrD-helicase domain-containing protein [Kribbella sp. NPDC000426]|uniref:UvrD-helicase domain-containing protein n=1 Tax=Kribbella sp. NPDC000426 TaxID=3154255 RepID=UPI003325D36C
MNRVTLAVAGARKTQSIVDACAGAPAGRRILTLTYTLTGQAELEGRLQRACTAGQAPEVLGWYAFLMRHWIRPYLPLLFPGHKLRGLNFEGEPARGRFATGAPRYLDSDDNAYKLYLSKLAHEVSKISGGAVIDRLSRLYDEIYIDEVQDLTGCDLHIVQALLESDIDVYMVGDIRQSVYDTNARDQNLRQFRGLKMVDWFEQQRDAGRLHIDHLSTTWRSNQIIATFSDTIIAKYGFEPTVSMHESEADHTGVFAVRFEDVGAYVAAFDPMCIRDTVKTAADVDLPFMNFGKVKGLTTDHVMIFPPSTVAKFIAQGTSLADGTACGLYVAVTRARHSVAFVLADVEASGLEIWKPS